MNVDKFYVIKLINRDGGRGYVIDTPDGIMISGVFHITTTQFPTAKEAEDFIRTRKLERQGTKAYVRSNDDIVLINSVVDQGLSKLEEAYCVENESGEKVFYDAKLGHYFFDKKDVGYCCWYTEEQAQNFINRFFFYQKCTIKRMGQNKKPGNE